MTTLHHLGNHQRLRRCDKCGIEDIVTTRLNSDYIEGQSLNDICDICTREGRAEAGNLKDLAALASMGYTNVSFSHINNHRKRCYSVAAPCCNTQQTMVMGNIKTLYKKNGIAPCSHCGAKARINAANNANKVNAISRTYDLSNLKDYTDLVTSQANKTVETYKGFFYNDLSTLGFKVSISSCFEQNIPVNLASSLLNVYLSNGEHRKNDLDIKLWLDRDLSVFDPLDLIREGLLESSNSEYLNQKLKPTLDITLKSVAPSNNSTDTFGEINGVRHLSHMFKKDSPEDICNVCAGSLSGNVGKVRTCQSCAEKYPTFRDIPAWSLDRRLPNISKELSDLEALGYSNVNLIGVNFSQDRMYEFNSPCCGSKNIFSYYAAYFAVKSSGGEVACHNCAQLAKAKKMNIAFAKTLGVSWRPELFMEYRVLVNRVSDKNYKTYKHIINPEDKPRTSSGIDGAYHLDHKMSVRDCYLHSIPVELAGSVLNLRMITASENTVKSSNSCLDLREWVGKDLTGYDVSDLHTVALDGHILNIEEPKNPAVHVEAFLSEQRDNKRGLAPATRAAQLKKVENNRALFIERMSEYGFVDGKFVDKNEKGVDMFSFIALSGISMIRSKRELDWAMQKGNDVRADGVSKSEAQALSLRNGSYKDSEETRLKKAEAAKRRKEQNGFLNSESARAKLAEAKKGRKRWYHPDFPSFKQSKECPGEGWSLIKGDKR